MYANVSLWAAVWVAATGPTLAHAERVEPLPRELAGIGITEKLDAQLPLTTSFVDENGETVQLGSYFGHGLPTILTFNYSDCPMLCSLQLAALVKGLRGVDWTAGEQFQIITVSMDPTETPKRAHQSHDRYVGDYQRAAAAAGWHFLTGAEASIRAAANAVGFNYGYDAVSKQYIHVPALILLRADGHVSRYLYGIDYTPTTLRLSLRETAEGKTVSTVDKLILFCFHYDAAVGRYAPAAQNIMRIGGGLTLLALVGFIGAHFWRERRHLKETARQ